MSERDVPVPCPERRSGLPRAGLPRAGLRVERLPRAGLRVERLPRAGLRVERLPRAGLPHAGLRIIRLPRAGLWGPRRPPPYPAVSGITPTTVHPRRGILGGGGGKFIHIADILPAYCLGNGGPYDMEGFQKCLHPLKVLAKAYV